MSKKNKKKNRSSEQSGVQQMAQETSSENMPQTEQKVSSESVPETGQKETVGNGSETGQETIINSVQEMGQKKKIPLWGKIAIGVLVVVLLLGGGAYGIIHYYYNQMNIKGLEEDNTPAATEYFDTDENTANLEELDPDSIHLDSAEAVSSSKDVINILLCGEENIGGGRGRTDSIMIATINQRDNELKLTSIMRDSYVQIPGYTDNKINAAYHNGGMKSSYHNNTKLSNRIVPLPQVHYE